MPFKPTFANMTKSTKTKTPEGENDLILRPCFEQDLWQVQLIYAHHVMTGTGTFEITPPDLEEMQARWRTIVASGWPFLVAARSSDVLRVIGYAYAQQFRMREAYARTFENSIYVAPGQERKGVGVALLATLLHELQSMDIREVIAVIGDSDNHASIRLHEKLGYRKVGVMREVGEKFGKALDVVIMQASLAPKA
jgi:phosphinothricin acetyltransferase